MIDSIFAFGGKFEKSFQLSPEENNYFILKGILKKIKKYLLIIINIRWKHNFIHTLNLFEEHLELEEHFETFLKSLHYTCLV